jgi:16S rRNA A1518/A1519 N6-dimethyltransferase RsmA/KsgA/DIM1 with predicted DNA glycosylase/AP lyase activity
MAQVAAASDRGNLLEIGAGSGALTRALLAGSGVSV